MTVQIGNAQKAVSMIVIMWASLYFFSEFDSAKIANSMHSQILRETYYMTIFAFTCNKTLLNEKKSKKIHPKWVNEGIFLISNFDLYQMSLT